MLLCCSQKNSNAVIFYRVVCRDIAHKNEIKLNEFSVIIIIYIFGPIV